MKAKIAPKTKDKSGHRVNHSKKEQVQSKPIAKIIRESD